VKVASIDPTEIVFVPIVTDAPSTVNVFSVEAALLKPEPTMVTVVPTAAEDGDTKEMLGAPVVE